MSRYRAKLENPEKIVCWGFDHMCGYFIEEYDASKGTEDNEDGMIFNISSYNTIKAHPNHNPEKVCYTNSELLEIYENYSQIPEVHKEALAGDLAF